METREGITIINQGQKIFGVLHRPIQETAPPLVVFLHGFASHKIGTNRCYVTLAEQLSSLGIASLRFDFRGSGDSEGSLALLSFEDLVSDAVAILKYAQTLPSIDPTRMAIFGSSLGATISVFAAQAFKQLTALILWSPIATGELWVRDFMARHPASISDSPSELISSYRGLPISPGFQKQFSCIMAAQVMEELGEIPLLHMHGENDQVVSLIHQTVYKQHCKERQAPARFLSFPDTEHCMGTSAAFGTVIEESSDWLKRYLLGEHTHESCV